MQSSKELIACSDQLVNQIFDHFEIARRNKDVEVNGTKYYIGQTVPTFRNHDGDTVLDIRPEEIDVVSRNSHWFERNVNKDDRYNSTTLHLGPAQVKRGGATYGGSIILPQRFKESGLGNGGLIDPITGCEVPFSAPIYDARWLQVSKWMLDELRSPDDLVYSLGWGTLRDNPVEKNQKVRLIEAVDTHVFISADEQEDPIGVTRNFLLFNNAGEASAHYSVYVRGDDKPLVVRNDAFLEVGELYPALDQEEDSEHGEKARMLLATLPQLVELHTR